MVLSETPTALTVGSACLRGADIALPVRPLHAYLESAAADHPDRPWLSAGSSRITYGEGLYRVGRIAAWLVASGLAPGDRVALLMPNSIAYALIAFACWRQGLVLVGLNPLYANGTLRRMMQDAQPAMVLTFAEGDLPERLDQIANGIAAKRVTLPAGHYFDPALLNGIAAAPHPCEDAVLAVLQYTGGTTGTPKGAMLSHNNMSACVEQLLLSSQALRRGQESFLALGPFSHVIGSTLTLSLATAVAAEIVIPDRFHPESTTQFCIDRAISVIFAVPTVFGAMARSAAAAQGDWSHLRYTMCGGAPLPPTIKAHFEQVTGQRLLQGYGSSETSSGAVCTAEERAYPQGSVGVPMPNCHIDIVAPNGALLAEGEIGEIHISGPNVMEGYWTGTLPTHASATSNRFATGDSGLIRDGALFVVDRLKDMIIASGYNIYPAQVEEVLLTHPAIAELAVIGAPDAYRGETVKAVAVLHPGMTLTLEMLQEFARDRLSALEMPRILDIRDALPRTAVGKIAKVELR